MTEHQGDTSVRSAVVERKTAETDIRLELTLDGTGKTDVKTGFGFADHMLTLLGYWAEFDLVIACNGDMYIDAHHSIEDVGLCLGEAFARALGNKAGIERVADARVPMDEALTSVVLDLSGRPYVVYQGDDVLPPVIAGEEKDLWREFFKSFAYKGGFNLHIHLEYGQNGHHMLEAAFKALGLALRRAISRRRRGVPSTKGSLDT
ncbi:imidazoleglycerol-phosphate dehydratase HisB [Desulfovibrio inopinatus]|uniref:imidazoleglycerol-phosphate dehydratase HisB n=1 Tax=Desulfovibrio inopinatus TaxID=102109 RepID=UPI000400B8D3|nr:imidazoleglycerol-phosphate dehydratase HisB [Desulfovibrio inopinatus]